MQKRFKTRTFASIAVTLVSLSLLACSHSPTTFITKFIKGEHKSMPVQEALAIAWSHIDGIEAELMKKLGTGWVAKSIPGLVPCDSGENKTQIWTEYWGENNLNPAESIDIAIAVLENHDYTINFGPYIWDTPSFDWYSVQITAIDKFGSRFNIEATDHGELFIFGLSQCVKGSSRVVWSEKPRVPLENGTYERTID